MLQPAFTLFVALTLACRPAGTDKPAGTGDSAPGIDESTASDTANTTDTAPPDTALDTGPLPAGVFELVDPESWTPLDASADPFAAHRPAAIDCAPESMDVDLGLFEVDTGLCDYLSVGQPSLAAVRAGEVIEVLMYHGSLTWWEEATAHVAVSIDGVVLWEETIGIPAASEVYIAEVPSPVAVSPGTPIVFHLHNHGSNTWNIGHIKVRR